MRGGIRRKKQESYGHKKTGSWALISHASPIACILGAFVIETISSAFFKNTSTNNKVRGFVSRPPLAYTFHFSKTHFC
jgi:hypothetical protein